MPWRHQFFFSQYTQVNLCWKCRRFIA